jgi:hypothetical protein
VSELVAWLRAQVAEDERVAKRARGGRLPGADHWVAGEANADGVRTEAGTPVTQFSWPNEMEHIVRHDPARVLREVAAKRAIVDRVAEEAAIVGTPRAQAATAQEWWLVMQAHDVLRLLASVYAGRPGWRSEWAPDEEAL